MQSRPAISIIGPSVINALFARYEETWGLVWPFSRHDAAELVIEAKRDLGMKANDKTRCEEVRAETLVLMRETHHFPDFEPPFGSRSVEA